VAIIAGLPEDHSLVYGEEAFCCFQFDRLMISAFSAHQPSIDFTLFHIFPSGRIIKTTKLKIQLHNSRRDRLLLDRQMKYEI